MNNNYEIAIQRIEKALASQSEQLDLSGLSLSKLPEKITQLRQVQRLDISNNKLTSITGEIGQLNHLRELNLSHNNIRHIASGIRRLHNLQHLDLSYNKLNSLPREAGQLSKIEHLDLRHNNFTALPRAIKQLHKLRNLHLSHNRINQLPQDLTRLKALRILTLSHNQLVKLPNNLSHCLNLEQLHISHNQLTNLDESISELQQLQVLTLSHNHLHSLPTSICQLNNLSFLDLSNNHLASLPLDIGCLQQLFNTNDLAKDTGINLSNNRFNIPDEISNRSSAAIIQYLLDLQSSKKNKPLHEAKLIFIGTGYVGKTSLINRLIDNTYDPNEPQTDGIHIKNWHIKRNQHSIKLHIWDFGGQEIMHATHRFFMTGRTVYVLVINPRTEDKYGDSELEYWLKLIRSYANQVPIVVAINKCDTHKVDLARGELQDKYPNIVGFIETSCRNNVGINKLQKEIEKAIAQLPHIDDILPQSYFAIKQELESCNDDYISYTDYQLLCKKTAPNFGEKSMQTLMGLLHDLGVMLNFSKDRRLTGTQVLNPEWVTRGVYQIITSPKLIKRRGILMVRDIAKILDPKYYPSERERFFIMDIMDKFELCYQVPHVRDTYFVPGAFPKDRPAIDWSYNTNDLLRFQYQYDVMPSSIMSHFIIKVHDFIKGNNYWRNGVIIEKNACSAFIKADPEERKMHLQIIGNGNKRDLLSFVRSQFDIIHARLSNITVKSQIPINDSGTSAIDYEYLLFCEKIGHHQLPIKELDTVIDIHTLLDGIETASAREAHRVQTPSNRPPLGKPDSNTTEIPSSEPKKTSYYWAIIGPLIMILLSILSKASEILSFVFDLFAKK